MKAKWNLLMILFLLIGLAGGTATSARAQTAGDVLTLVRTFAMPEPSLVGYPMQMYVDFSSSVNNAVSAGIPYVCTVHYGDGTSGAGEMASRDGASVYTCLGDANHIYSRPDTYTVTFDIVSGEPIDSFTIEHTVTVASGNYITVTPNPASVNSPVTLTANVNAEEYDGFYWVLGDGNAGYLPQTFEWSYPTAGTYKVMLVAVKFDATTGTMTTLADGVEIMVLDTPPAPVLSAISPASAMAGWRELTLSVTGSNFTLDSRVELGGWPLETTYVSDIQLTAVVRYIDLANPQTAPVTVSTPNLYGGWMTSNVQAFFVTEAAAGVTSQDVASGDDKTASAGPATATATGNGLLVVAQYDANPGGTPSFSASGTYFDVYAASGNSFTQVNIVACGMTANDKLFWWDAALNKWVKASPQTYADDCITLVVTDSSSPSISQLQGTYFAAGQELAGWQFIGFTSPVDNPDMMNSAKAGQTIPLKWRLLDAAGAPVSNLTTAKVTVVNLSCSLGTTSDAVEEYSSGSSGLQNLGDGYYQFNWQTPKTYANSCKTMKLDIGEGAGTEHTALFKFTK